MRFIARHILSSRRRWRWGALIVLGLIVVLLLVLTGRAWGLREWTAQVLSQLRVMGAPVFFAAMAVLLSPAGATADRAPRLSVARSATP